MPFSGWACFKLIQVIDFEKIIFEKIISRHWLQIYATCSATTMIMMPPAPIIALQQH
jgi:hypothetical protein